MHIIYLKRKIIVDAIISYFTSLNPMNLLTSMPGAIAQGIIWGIMALGVYITFRILDIADLTVDSSFTTGAAVTVMLKIAGFPMWSCLLIAVLVGLVAGAVTGLLHTKLGIPAILAGILTQLALYSINLRIMGMSANKSYMFGESDLYVNSGDITKSIVISGIIAIAIIFLMYWYFGTEQGSALRATGSNHSMSSAQGINISTMKIIGLALSDALVALSGGLMSQYQGYTDINMGRGAIVIGLAAVIIGEVIGYALLGKHINFWGNLAFVVFGGIVYYIVITIVLWLKLNTNDLKLFTAVVVALFLAVPYLKAQKKSSFKLAKREGKSQMLKINQIEKTFNPGTINEKKALCGVSLSLNEGDFVTIIGGNGAGKSTLMNAITGVWPVDNGSIYLDGINVTGLKEFERAKYIGRVFQDPMMGTAPDMQIAENLALAYRRGRKRTLRWGITSAEKEMFREKLSMLGLGLEDRMTSKVGLLSGGQRQAITLLMASLQKPEAFAFR